MRAGRLRHRGRCDHPEPGRDRRCSFRPTRFIWIRARGVDRHGDDGSWTIDKLDVTQPGGLFQGQGTIPPRPGHGAWLEATVDLAAVARQLPATLHLRDDLRVERGSARLRADIQSDETGTLEDWKVAGNVSDLAARLGRKNIDTVRAGDARSRSLQQGETATKLERLDIQTPAF